MTIIVWFLLINPSPDMTTYEKRMGPYGTERDCMEEKVVIDHMLYKYQRKLNATACVQAAVPVRSEQKPSQ